MNNTGDFLVVVEAYLRPVIVKKAFLLGMIKKVQFCFIYFPETKVIKRVRCVKFTDFYDFYESSQDDQILLSNYISHKYKEKPK